MIAIVVSCFSKMMIYKITATKGIIMDLVLKIPIYWQMSVSALMLSQEVGKKKSKTLNLSL